MEDKIQAAFGNLIAEGVSMRDLVECAVEFVADIAVTDHAADGVRLDPDDAYDAIVDGIRSSAERSVIDGT